MRHPDDGRLTAWLDRELSGEGERAVTDHVSGCPRCARTAATLGEAAELARKALPSVDVPPPVERVGAALARRRRGAGAASSSWWRRRSRLARAAALVLLAAGGVSAALPGSPVREWMERLGRGGGDAPVPAATTGGLEAERPGGARIAPSGGRIVVRLRGLPVGSELRVTLVAGERALVLAPASARFRVADGRLDATVPDGPVRVELPREAREVSLEVNGRRYLTMRAGRLEVVVPASDSSDTQLLFRTR